MKKTRLIVIGVLIVMVFTIPSVKAQEWSAGLDIYSSYLWRGAKFGTGAAFQPSVEFSTGGFAIGAWGSYSTGSEEAAEADLYASYSFDLGEKSSFTILLTDYYFPGDNSEPSEWLKDYSHSFEPLISVGVGSFTFTAAYMTGIGDDNDVDDLYLEAALAAGPVDLILGAGDGQYTDDGDFNVCNIGLGTSRDIKITETFTLPLSGAVVLNPATQAFNIAVGISL